MKSRQSWAELYAFELDRASDAPLFRQIYLQLRSAILSGVFRPGMKLPSTRELAVQLGVSRSAAVAAFEQLLAEGYAAGKKGAGTYVASDLPEAFAALQGRKQQSVSSAKVAASRELDGLVDVTAYDDEWERRAALLSLQRLLAKAEGSFSSGAADVDPALRQVGRAFDQFRSRYREGADEPVPQTPAAEARRRALLTLANALAEMDESLSQRDRNRIRDAIDNARDALDVCRQLDEAAHTSGVRLRLSGKIAK